MNTKNLLLLCLLLLGYDAAKSQIPDALIRAAWQNDAQLKAAQFQLQSAESALLEAKSMYGPSLSFGTQYTRAAGGRVIEVPIGDIVNPVYSTLNALTQSNMFPTLQNEKTYFLPDNFYDSRFRIQQAIYYPDLQINKQLKTEQKNLKQLEITAYKRLLSKEVMTAYYGSSSASGLIEILSSARNLLLEVKKLTESMVRNGIALPAAIYRINSDIADLDIKILDAQAQLDNIRSYISFLTGQESNSDDNKNVLIESLPPLRPENPGIREELSQLDLAVTMNRLSLKNEENFYKPKIGAVLDLGSQAFDFGWAPYVLFGLNIEMNLYDSGKIKHRRSQAKAAIDAAEYRKLHVSRQLNLQQSNAMRNYDASVQKVSAMTPKTEAAERTYKDVLTAYKAGTAGYIEMLDARNNLTNTQIEYNLSKYDAWQKYAELLYTTAAYPIDTEN